jgi:methylase of polypeptide subunit release factors
MNLSKVEHLTKDQIIKKGSIYTPETIVSIAKEWLIPFISKNDYVLDFGVGYGAFISKFTYLSHHCIATDVDSDAIALVNDNFPEVKTYTENSLVDPSRHKYSIPIDSNLFIIGNPPYNDVTSQFKKNQKGSFKIDSRLKSRDLGISLGDKHHDNQIH